MASKVPTHQEVTALLVKRALAGSNNDRAVLIFRARKAEATLAAIAKTRRPTEQETADALDAYAGAAKVASK